MTSQVLSPQYQPSFRAVQCGYSAGKNTDGAYKEALSAACATSAAEAKRSTVQMQVIEMRGVVIGTQNTVEKPARAVTHLVHELRFSARALPVAGNAQSPAIGQHESGHIPCLGGCVPAAGGIRATVYIPARVAAEMFDAGNRLAEVFQ